MQNKKLVIVGGEGNGGVVAACVEDNRARNKDFEWDVVGFLNDFETGEILGYPILGRTSEVQNLIEQGCFFFFAIHTIGRNRIIDTLYDLLAIPKDRLATVIHFSAFVSNAAKISPGVLIMSNCYIGPAASIGESNMIMANVSIGHNTSSGRLCHFSVGSIVSSYVTIGEVSDVTLGAKVLEKRCIGKYSVIGAGGLVTKDIPDNEIHIGSPNVFLKNTLNS